MRDEPDRPWVLPPDLPRVLGRAEALALGYSRNAIGHRLATRQWRRVLPATYLTADSFGDHDRLEAALIFAGRGAALSGAAGLWASGVRGVQCPHLVLVLVPSRNRRESFDWVRIRATARPIVTELAPGPRRAEVARSAADHALQLTRLDDVRAIVAGVVQARRCTVAELGRELQAGPRAGSAHLRRALTEVGWGAVSAPEARAARMLRRAGLAGFVVNFTITLPDGRTRVIDFYWPELRACLEIDSVEWHFGVAEWRATWDRHLELTTRGYSVIHRPPSALDDELRFVHEIRDWLAGRAAELRRPTA